MQLSLTPQQVEENKENLEASIATVLHVATEHVSITVISHRMRLRRFLAETTDVEVTVLTNDENAIKESVEDSHFSDNLIQEIENSTDLEHLTISNISVHEEHKETEDSDDEKKSATTVIVVIVCLALVFIGLGIIWYVDNEHKKQEAAIEKEATTEMGGIHSAI